MSKEYILRRIRKHKPPLSDLPKIPDFVQSDFEVLPAFQAAVEGNSGTLVQLESTEQLTSWVETNYKDCPKRLSFSHLMEGTMNVKPEDDPRALQDIDLVILPAALGVAENGAIWVDETHCPIRVLPFITQHLLILLSRDKIVQNMHQAYDRIQIDTTGFGLFVAGPSKTADIEQSLVIGAQGARSLSVGILMHEGLDA